MKSVENRVLILACLSILIMLGVHVFTLGMWCGVLFLWLGLAFTSEHVIL